MTERPTLRTETRKAGLNRRAALRGGAALALVSACPGWAVRAAESTKIRVLAAPTAFEPLYIGNEQGLFAKHGLAVEVVPGGTADSMIAQMLNGQVQFGLSSALAVIISSSKGLPIKLAVGNLTGGIQPVTAALVVPGDSPIKGLADLKGRKIAFAGLRSQPHLTVLAAIKEVGIDAGSISFVEMPPPTLQGAATKGTVDAIYTLEPFLSAALSAGFRLVDPTLSRFLVGVPTVAFAASADYLTKNGEAAKAFIAAIGEAQAYANSNPDAVRAVDSRLTKLPPDFIKTRAIAPFTPVINLEGLRRMLTMAKDQGWIDRVPTVAELVYEQGPTQ